MVKGLEGKGIELLYPGGFQALSSVDLLLARARFEAVIGPNGAGKSSLLRCLSGLRKPDRGKIRVDGDSLSDLSWKARARKIALSLPDRDVPKGLRVRDLVLMARYPWLPLLGSPERKDHERVEASLERCGISALADRPYHALSTGERQRVLLARTLAQGTPYLLLDEPASNLDASHRLGVFSLLRTWVDETGGGVLVVTHDLNLASQFADRIHVLHLGKILASGTPGEVIAASVLSPVYGPELVYGRLCSGAVGEDRPWALPWRLPGAQ